MAPQNARDNANLDFLRSTAVLLVLADHVLEVIAHQGGTSFHPLDWRLGRLGVLMFFVHTSLVLMSSLERLVASGERRLFAAFMIRRVFRIYPLSIACVLLVVAARVPQGAWGAEYQAPSVGQLVSNLLLTQNLTYSQSVLMPLWSLPLEVQMYLLLPFVFWLLTPERRIGRALGLVGLAVVAALVQPMVVGRLDVAQFAPCFMGGVLAYTLMGRVGRQLPAWVWPAVVLGLVGSYLGLVSFTGEAHPRAGGWLLCIALGALIPLFRELRQPIVCRASLLVARYSYGIYLFHVVLLWFVFERLPAAPAIAQWGMFAALMIVVPMLTYHLVELPLMKVGVRLAARLRKASPVVDAPETAPVVLPRQVSTPGDAGLARVPEAV